MTGTSAIFSGRECLWVQAAGSGKRRMERHHAVRRHDDVDRDVVGPHLDRLGKDLDGVDRRRDQRPGSYPTGLDEERVLEIREAAALPHPGAARVHRHRTAHDEVDGRQRLDADRPPEALRAADRRRLVRALAEPGRIQLEETLEGPEPRHRHVDHLALTEGHPAHRELRRVGIDLDRARVAPCPEPLEMERGSLGPDEVGNPAGRARKPADPADLHLAPHSGTRLDLRQHLIAAGHGDAGEASRDRRRADPRAPRGRSGGAEQHVGVTRKSSAQRRRRPCGDSRSRATACQRARHPMRPRSSSTRGSREVMARVECPRGAHRVLRLPLTVVLRGGRAPPRAPGAVRGPRHAYVARVPAPAHARSRRELQGNAPRVGMGALSRARA